MVYARLSTSRKWNALTSDQARLLYLMVLLHTDDLGRMDAEPPSVKMIAVPGLDWTSAQISGYISELDTIGLIKLYEAEGHKYLVVSDFDDYQTFERERQPQYPEPPDYTADKCCKSEVLQRKGKVREGKGREGKTRYGDEVWLKEEEYQSLLTKHGEPGVKRLIEILDNYKGANGKEYISDHKAILNWVEKRLEEEKRAAPKDAFANMRRL